MNGKKEFRRRWSLPGIYEEVVITRNLPGQSEENYKKKLVRIAGSLPRYELGTS
jgi:hypothetical protein